MVRLPSTNVGPGSHKATNGTLESFWGPLGATEVASRSRLPAAVTSAPQKAPSGCASAPPSEAKASAPTTQKLTSHAHETMDIDDVSDSDIASDEEDRASPQTQSRKAMFEELATLMASVVEGDITRASLTLADIPVMRLPGEPHLFAWKANRIFDKAIRDDGVPLPQERVLSKHRQLMALIQLYEIRKSIQQGKKSVAWWQTLLRAYVGKDDWVLTWRKVIKKGPCQPKVDDMPRLITKEATRMSGQDPMRRLRSSLEVNNLHGSVAVLLEKRWSKLTRLPLLKIPKHRQQGQTTEKRRVERDELLKQFPKIARYVLQAEAILPGSGAAALSSKLTIWQLSKIVCILGAQAQDVSYCGAHTLFRTFEKAELAQIGAKLCKQPVKYVWLLQLKQAMTDDQCKRWLSVQQENSTVARNNLLDEQGRHLFEMKTPAAKLSEKSYFRYRAKDALVAQAQEDAGTGRSWSCQRYEPPPEKIKELTLIYRQLWEETPNCPLCGVELTAINEVEAAEQTRKGVRSTNASMDRKTPGSQGGRYEANNLQCMCAGCNYLKLHYTFEATVDTVKRLRDARATWKSSSNGFIALEREPSSVPATAAQRAKIEKWAECKRRSLSSGAEKRQLSCTVSVTDITKMLLDRMCAAMLFQDAVGMVLPLEQLSIDRIDPMKGYEPTNIRLLLTQLNMIRRECPDDEPIIRYIESIRK